ncbi:MAG TPA: glycosyltransferase family 4 protein [Balneolaceae bacterium]|nr:glycosyltransferase family 4 protein [Balneolaceae bacterium]
MKKIKNAFYLIPYPRFFSQHNNVGGHVAHAYGVTSTLANQGYTVRIIMEEPIGLMEGDCRIPEIIKLEKNSLIHRIFWGKKLVDKVGELAAMDNPEFCYVRYSVGFQNWLPLLKKKLGNIPLILEVNSFGSQRHKWMSIFEGLFLNAADLLVLISDPVYKSIDTLWGDKLTNKSVIVNNGVDPDRFSDWENNCRRDFGSKVKLGYTGLIESWYGLDDVALGFIKANKKSDREIEFHIYGDGPYKAEMEKKYSEYKSIIFHGAQPFQEMPGIIGSLDILINADSEEKSYTSPIKIYEYMASGRPILSARSSQSEMQLDHGRLGWFYDMGDPESFCEAVISLINEGDQITSRTIPARKFVEKNHTWEHRVNHILNHIENLKSIHQG